MPVYSDALRQANLGQTIANNPRVAEFWRTAHHFVDRQSGGSLGDPWGILLRGYGDIGMPGYEGQNVFSDTVDNRFGLAKVTEVTRQPSGRDVALHYLSGTPSHRLIGTTAINERVAMRHIGPPPQMDLTHSVDLVGRRAGAAVNEQQGRVDVFTLTPVAYPVTIGGVYFEAGNYSAEQITSNNGITLQASFTAGERYLEGATTADLTSLSSIALKIGADAETNGATKIFNIRGSIGADMPPGYSRRAMVIAPGVGYSVSNPDTTLAAAAAAVDTPFNELVFPADEDLIDAVLDELPELFIAIWQWPTARGAL